MSWSEAISRLRSLGYGLFAASGLLAVADRDGSAADGGTFVSGGRRGYRVWSC